MKKPRKVIIIGGGIGGLCAAIALYRLGIDIVVCERAREIRPLGAGITLGANAVLALSRLGVADQLLESGELLRRLVICDASGKPLSETDSLIVSRRYGTDNLVIHRAELHQILLDQLPPNTVKAGKACTDFMQDEQGVTVMFADGTEERGDLLIAADGLRSLVRTRLVPKSEPRYAGYTCWRAVIEKRPSGMDGTIASETWGTGGRFGIVPLSKGRIYWFACIRARENDPDIAAYGSSELLGRFGKYHSPIPEIIEMTANEQLLHHDLYDIRPLRRFVYQRTALLGDAAHAMTPNMGQGACQAIEDAVLLGRSLELSDTLEEGLALYEQSRVSRTSKIIRLSRTIGAVAQWENRAAAGLRNAVLRSMPKDSAMKQLKFLYHIDLEPHRSKRYRSY